MKTERKVERDALRMRLATALDKAVQGSRYESYRELAREVGIDQAHLHLIVAGKKDVWLSTLVALVQALGLSLEEFGRLFDGITDKEVAAYVLILEARRKEKGTKRSGKASGKGPRRNTSK